MITHDSIREIAKQRLHWSGGRVEVLKYCDEQEAKDIKQEKKDKLLNLYRELYYDDGEKIDRRIKRLEDSLR